MNNNKKIARIAGLLYLIVIICGVFAELVVRAKLFDIQDTGATVSNIQSSEFLFRLSFVSDLMMQTSYFFLPMVLFLLFKKVNKPAASAMVLSVTVAVAIMCTNMLNHYAPLQLLSNVKYLNGFSAEQLHTQVMFYLDLHNKGYHIAQIFFGIWLLPLGYLVYQSGMFPKIIGIFLMVGCFGYLADFIVFFLFPDAKNIAELLTIPADLGEISFCLYLLIKGIRDQNVPFFDKSNRRKAASKLGIFRMQQRV